jgi:hypothetical protein
MLRKREEFSSPTPYTPTAKGPTAIGSGGLQREDCKPGNHRQPNRKPQTEGVGRRQPSISLLGVRLTFGGSVRAQNKA